MVYLSREAIWRYVVSDFRMFHFLQINHDMNQFSHYMIQRK